MQNRDKASIEREAETVTTKELARVLARKDKEDFATFQQGEIALDNAAYNDSDDNTITTGTGKIITNNRARNNRYHTHHHEKDPNGIKALAESMAALGLTLVLIQQWAQRAVATPSSLSGTFGHKSKDEQIADAEYIYEGEDVSAETARLLNNRLARILRAQKELEDITDPEEYAAKKDLLDRLIERSGVRAHDKIGFAYDPVKVAKIENFLNPDEVDCTGMVCVYRPRAAAHDSRRMKIDVGDQYDQDPTETIGEVKGIQAPAIPIAIPTFKIS